MAQSITSSMRALRIDTASGPAVGPTDEPQSPQDLDSDLGISLRTLRQARASLPDPLPNVPRPCRFLMDFLVPAQIYDWFFQVIVNYNVSIRAIWVHLEHDHGIELTYRAVRSIAFNFRDGVRRYLGLRDDMPLQWQRGPALDAYQAYLNSIIRLLHWAQTPQGLARKSYDADELDMHNMICAPGELIDWVEHPAVPELMQQDLGDTLQGMNSGEDDPVERGELARSTEHGISDDMRGLRI